MIPNPLYLMNPPAREIWEILDTTSPASILVSCCVVVPPHFLCHYFCVWLSLWGGCVWNFYIQHPRIALAAGGPTAGVVAFTSCLVRGNLASLWSSRPWNKQSLLIPLHPWVIPDNPGLIPSWFRGTPSWVSHTEPCQVNTDTVNFRVRHDLMVISK